MEVFFVFVKVIRCSFFQRMDFLLDAVALKNRAGYVADYPSLLLLFQTDIGVERIILDRGRGKSASVTPACPANVASTITDGM